LGSSLNAVNNSDIYVQAVVPQGLEKPTGVVTPFFKAAPVGIRAAMSSRKYPEFCPKEPLK